MAKNISERVSKLARGIMEEAGIVSYTGTEPDIDVTKLDAQTAKKRDVTTGGGKCNNAMDMCDGECGEFNDESDDEEFNGGDEFNEE